MCQYTAVIVFPHVALAPLWLQRTLPWGTFSSLRLMNPTESDDGPIMWVRPGEQMIPVADVPKSPFKRKRWVQQQQMHTYTTEARHYFRSFLSQQWDRDRISRDLGLCECCLHWPQVTVVCVCVFACAPHWASCTAHEDRLWRNSPKTHWHIWSSSRASSIKLCCRRAVQDEAITPSLFVSVTVSLLHTRKLCLSLSVTHTHIWFLWGRPWAGMCVVCVSPLRWDHRYVNRVDIRRYFTWQLAKQRDDTHQTHSSISLQFQ